MQCRFLVVTFDRGMVLFLPLLETLMSPTDGKYMPAGSVGSTSYLRMKFFFHEYGRRVGMVPRSSLKERKYSQMVEKRTKTTQQQTKQNQPQPTGRDSTIK